jgi:hypothetical protein
MMPVMAGNQNRERHQDERRNQAASPPFIFSLRRVFEAFDASLEAPQRLVILTRATA